MITLFEIRKKALATTLGFFSCIAVLTSCKEKTFTNADAIPEVDNINTFEWIGDDFKFETKYNDSLLTSDPKYTLASIGVVNDPFFGKSYGGVYFQVGVPNIGFAIPENIIVDSSVISIPYYVNANNISYAFGDTTSSIKFNAYRVTGDFVYGEDKQYYAHDSFAYHTNPLGATTTLMRNLRDTIVLANGDTLKHVLRIKLSNQFTQELGSLSAEQTAYSSSLQEVIKGFYIAPDFNYTNTNVIGLFILDQGTTTSYSLAQLTMYYRNQGDSVTKKIELKYKNDVCSWFNRYRRNYTNSPAAAFLDNKNTDSAIVQSKPGIYTDLTIALNTNLIGDAIIHKSDVVLTTLKVGSDDKFAVPTQLIVKGLDENNQEYDLLDFSSSSGYEYIQAQPILETVNGQQLIRYHINIPRETQLLASKNKQQLKLRIYASNAHPGFYRAVLGGTKNDEYSKPRLSIVYSKK